MQTFSVIIADDDHNICDALRDLIGDDPRFEVRGVVHSGADAAELVGTQRVDLAVVDVQMPQGGAEAIEAIHAVSPFTHVVVFTAKSGSRLHSQLMGAGAAAVLKKGDALDLSEALVRLLTD
jgi:DNA-binding NarL/FixJ family response regulator